MSVLMRDVAAKARVSITTVSHVLNDTRPVALRTRQRVLKAAEQLRYYKNTSARLLVRGRSDLVGLVISDIDNPFFPELIKSFERAAMAQRLEVLVCATSYDRVQTEKAVRRMLENRVLGVAVMTSQFDADLEAQFTAVGVPVVLLGPPLKGVYRGNIEVDYSIGLAAACEHLNQLGHRVVALAAGPLHQVSARAYKETVVTEMGKIGRELSAIFEGDHHPESGAQAARELLAHRDRPTAIVFANDRMAIGAMGAISGLGLRVPEDVSIIGADDIWMARYCHPPLTTVRIARDRLGRMAFDTLLEMTRSKSKRKAGPSQVLETELVIRRSTGPVIAHPAAFEQITKTRANA